MAREFEVQWEATEEAERLLEEVLNGEELDAYRLQLSTYVRAQRPLGKSFILIKRKPHHLWIDVYVSEKLRTVFPLMYHFNRVGEPTEKHLRELEDYIRQIREQEDAVGED